MIKSKNKKEGDDDAPPFNSISIQPNIPFMKKSKLLLTRAAIITLAFSLVSTGFAGVADPGGEVSRKIFDAQKDSLLWISVVAKISYTSEGATDSPMNLPEQENKLEAYGTVITSDGLLVTALSSIDQSRYVSGREITTRTGSRVKLDASVDIKEVRIIMPDGEEVPADVVFKDTDLDLAFVRARADSKQFKAAKFLPIDLKNSAKAVIAEETITLLRADDVLNRQPSIVRGQVTVLVKKPREFVRATSAAPGTPTFNTESKLLGIGTVRFMQGKQPTVVLIPSPDVLELVEQAKAAKAKPVEKEEKKVEKSETPEKSESK